MNIDFLIVGQGLAGSILAYELIRAKKNIIIVDDYHPLTASKTAGAILNPYDNKDWKLNKENAQIIKEAKEYYLELEKELNEKFFYERPMMIFNEEVIEGETYFKKNSNKIIEGIGQVNGQKLLKALGDYFLEMDVLKQKDELISYSFTKIIYCEGAQGSYNKLFKHLPFTKNRGDVLLLKIPNLSPDYIYQYKTRLVPMDEDIFWCGSNYLWNVDHLIPTDDWKKEQINILNEWLKVPFEIVDHLVAERPTTAGQFPLMGYHHLEKNKAIFNGFGTRGFSLIPFFAPRFVDYLLGNSEKIQDYDGERFEKLMKKI